MGAAVPAAMQLCFDRALRAGSVAVGCGLPDQRCRWHRDGVSRLVFLGLQGAAAMLGCFVIPGALLAAPQVPAALFVGLRRLLQTCMRAAAPGRAGERGGRRKHQRRARRKSQKQLQSLRQLLRSFRRVAFLSALVRAGLFFRVADERCGGRGVGYYRPTMRGTAASYYEPAWQGLVFASWLEKRKKKKRALCLGFSCLGGEYQEL